MLMYIHINYAFGRLIILLKVMLLFNKKFNSLNKLSTNEHNRNTNDSISSYHAHEHLAYLLLTSRNAPHILLFKHPTF